MSASELDFHDVHLVGSIGLASVRDVFHAVGRLLGPRLRRIPDGEVGGRRSWVGWQQPLIRTNPYLAPDPNQLSPTNAQPLFGLAPGVESTEVSFGELGYAHEARASYQLFLDARHAGDIPAGVRFQVCLPTPLAVAFSNFARSDFETLEAAYEAAMVREVAALADAIPHGDLAVQWDVCHEMIMWDGQLPEFQPPFDDAERAIVTRLARLCASVPREVDCGVHLCYGDNRGRHFVQPRDASRLVAFANAIAAAVPRPLNYVHVPVPIERTDDAFFVPLDGLRLGEGTGLYLGLVHADGKPKIAERIAAARRHAPRFGIATECGMARARRPELVMTLLEAHLV